MKPHVLALVSIATSTFFLSLPALALSSKSNPVRVSVAKFTDKTASGGLIGSGCHSYYAWADRLGGAFSDLLVEKLESNPKLEVLERSAIYDIYEKEVDLLNSEKDKSISRGDFHKAKISFVGVVDGFEFCESGTGASINVGRIFGFGDITPSVKSSNAAISVVIRAVDTTTGKILATARSKKTQSRRGVGLDVDFDVVDFSGKDFRQTMLAETIREAIDEAADGILGKLRL